jgi:hypothetical protein
MYAFCIASRVLTILLSTFFLSTIPHPPAAVLCRLLFLTFLKPVELSSIQNHLAIELPL